MAFAEVRIALLQRQLLRMANLLALDLSPAVLAGRHRLKYQKASGRRRPRQRRGLRARGRAIGAGVVGVGEGARLELLGRGFKRDHPLWKASGRPMRA